MLIRLFSDIHLDFDVKHGLDIWQPNHLPNDHEMTLVIAGDLWYEANWAKPTSNLLSQNEPWIVTMSKRFKHVVLVLGNHDYWTVTYEREFTLKDNVETCRKLIADLGLTNVHLLEQSAVVLDGVKFVGGVLWTSMKKGGLKFRARSVNNTDYTFIRFGPKRERLDADDVYEVHRQTVRSIHRLAVRDNPDQRLVVLTHMAPSFQSIDSMYHTSAEYNRNFFYFSDLERTALATKADFWFHGHIHKSADYSIGDTRVLCNPRGYSAEQITDYDPWLIIDTETKEVKRTDDLMYPMGVFRSEFDML